MAEFTPGQHLWYYVHGMLDIKNYIFHHARNSFQYEVTEVGDSRPEPELITLHDCACFSTPAKALEILVEWETEELCRLNNNIAEDTRERDRILNNRQRRALNG